MAPPDVHARMAGGHQGAGDAQVLRLAQQVVRVVQAEGQAQYGADGPQGDVALVPGDAHAQHFAALPLALAHRAEVGDGGGIRTRVGTGEREGRNLQALGQARQIVLFLCVGAVVQQKFGGPQGVGHHDAHGGGGAAGGQLVHHRRVGPGGEALATVFPGDDHAQEALVLDVLPHVGRQVVVPVGGVPVVGDAAQLLCLHVQELALLGGQLWLRQVQQALPVGAAAEQLAFPPHRARFQGHPLGVGHGRQDGAIGTQQWRGDRCSAQRRQVEHQRQRTQRHKHRQHQPRRPAAGERDAAQQNGKRRGPGRQRRAQVSQCHHHDGQQQPQQCRHTCLLVSGAPPGTPFVFVQRRAGAFAVAGSGARSPPSRKDMRRGSMSSWASALSMSMSVNSCSVSTPARA